MGRLDPSDERYQYWGTGSRMFRNWRVRMALAQMRKVSAITGRMRDAKWKIRRGITDVPGIKMRDIADPNGDTGPFLITVYRSAEECQRVTAALQAEGVRGQDVSLT